MKKKLILLIAGFFLLIPDPIPLVDEGVALALFIKTLKDILLERRTRRVQAAQPHDDDGPIIDVD